MRRRIAVKIRTTHINEVTVWLKSLLEAHQTPAVELVALIQRRAEAGLQDMALFPAVINGHTLEREEIKETKKRLFSALKNYALSVRFDDFSNKFIIIPKEKAAFYSGERVLVRA
jgi:hypothetical protein